MKRYKCTLCGYIYEPEKGDSDAAIPAGTSFAQLPEDWTCPVCRIGKDKFIEIEITESGNYYETNPSKEERIAPQNGTRIEETVNNHNYDNHTDNSGCES